MAKTKNKNRKGNRYGNPAKRAEAAQYENSLTGAAIAMIGSLRVHTCEHHGPALVSVAKQVVEMAGDVHLEYGELISLSRLRFDDDRFVMDLDVWSTAETIQAVMPTSAPCLKRIVEFVETAQDSQAALDLIFEMVEYCFEVLNDLHHAFEQLAALTSDTN